MGTVAAQRPGSGPKGGQGRAPRGPTSRPKVVAPGRDLDRLLVEKAGLHEPSMLYSVRRPARNARPTSPCSSSVIPSAISTVSFVSLLCKRPLRCVLTRLCSAAGVPLAAPFDSRTPSCPAPEARPGPIPAAASRPAGPGSGRCAATAARARRGTVRIARTMTVTSPTALRPSLSCGPFLASTRTTRPASGFVLTPRCHPLRSLMTFREPLPKLDEPRCPPRSRSRSPWRLRRERSRLGRAPTGGPSPAHGPLHAHARTSPSSAQRQGPARRLRQLLRADQGRVGCLVNGLTRYLNPLHGVTEPFSSVSSESADGPWILVEAGQARQGAFPLEALPSAFPLPFPLGTCRSSDSSWEAPRSLGQPGAIRRGRRGRFLGRFGGRGFPRLLFFLSSSLRGPPISRSAVTAVTMPDRNITS